MSLCLDYVGQERPPENPNKMFRFTTCILVEVTNPTEKISFNIVL